MNKIVLHGSLKETFGGPFCMDVGSVREAFYALSSQLEGFERAVIEGAFRIVRRKRKDRTKIDKDLLDLGCNDCVIDIYPAVVGAGKGGLAKIVLGIVVIGAAIVTAGMAAPAGAALFGAGGAMGMGIGFMGITYGMLASFGVMMALGGISMLFAPSPNASGAKMAENQSSYILSGPINSTAQGGPVALNYGKSLVGTTVISSEITIDQLLAAGETYDADVNYAGYGFGDYPGATTGAGGSGTGGSIVVDDIWEQQFVVLDLMD